LYTFGSKYVYTLAKVYTYFEPKVYKIQNLSKCM
jgi:hypothetical protein